MLTRTVRAISWSLAVALLAAVAVTQLPAPAGAAQCTPDTADTFQVAYYSTLTNGGVSADNVLRLINPTFQPLNNDPNDNSGGFLCAMIYVYDANEEIQECCGCPVTNNGLRTISVINDLTSNFLTPNIGGVPVDNTHGVIKIVKTRPVNNSDIIDGIVDPFGPCNPAIVDTDGDDLTPTLRGSITHPRQFPQGIGEVVTSDSPLCPNELSALVNGCSNIHTEGSGHGICTCGTGDNAAATPRSHHR